MLWELLEAIFVVSFFTVSSNMKPRFWTTKPKQSYGPVATEISKVQGHCGNQVFEQNRRRDIVNTPSTRCQNLTIHSDCVYALF